MPSRTIKLTEQHEKFVAEQVQQGRFRDASEVLNAGLRLLEQEAREDSAKLAVLQQLAAEGFSQLDQGRGIELSGQAELQDFIRNAGRRAAATIGLRSLE